MSDGSVHIKNLVKTYLDEHGNPSFTAVKNINLDIRDGEFMVLVWDPAAAGNRRPCGARGAGEHHQRDDFHWGAGGQ